MRKLFIILLALILSIIMIVPVALPAAAANPNDNKPVNWVSYGGTNANSERVGGHLGLSVEVKELADTSIFGHFTSRNFDTGQMFRQTVLDAFFIQAADGKAAHLLTLSEGWNFWWNLTDVGEPGAGRDKVFEMIWGEWNGGLTGTDADFSIPGEPPAFLDYSKIYMGQTLEIGEPWWFTFIPYVELSSGNVQVHIGE